MESEYKQNGEDFGLGVAQIVITAATPMIEEPEQPFPPPEEEKINHEIGQNESKTDIGDDFPNLEENKQESEVNGEEVEEKSVADDQPTDSAPFPISSSSEG